MKLLNLACIFALAMTEAWGGLIVNLDPNVANYDSDSDGYGVVSIVPPNNTAGITFNVTFTPAAGDLNSATDAVNLIEIGGDANGTGLYLLGGEVHFISKMDGNSANVPAFDDLDFASGNNMIGVKPAFGALTAGTEYSLAAIYDPLGAATLQLALMPTGGTLQSASFNLTGIGGKTNWSGDDSVTALQEVVVNGGGTNTVGGNPFSEALINGNPFEGTQGRALWWNSQAIVVPEPATGMLLLSGLMALAAFRRR